MTPSDIRAFEAEIAEAYNSGAIKAPIHLDGGNEKQLCAYFAQSFMPGDWVCCSWRSHAKALLAGVPPENVRAEIMAGHSITLCFPEYRVVSSAIVGGILPIALGLALGAKRRGGNEKIHCFLGDMTARAGLFHECREYSISFDLPIEWIIEDNGKSVKTDTREVWGAGSIGSFLLSSDPIEIDQTGRLRSVTALKTTYFHYYPIYPHSGTGQWIRW